MGSDSDLWVALEVRELAKLEGELFADGPITGHDLESVLNDIAGAAGHDDLYLRRASMIEGLLDEAERMKAMTLLAPLGRAVFRKTLKARAMRNLDSRYKQAQARASGESRG